MNESKDFWMKIRPRWSLISILLTLTLAWSLAIALVMLGGPKLLPLSLSAFVLVEWYSRRPDKLLLQFLEQDLESASVEVVGIGRGGFSHGLKGPLYVIVKQSGQQERLGSFGWKGHPLDRKELRVGQHIPIWTYGMQLLPQSPSRGMSTGQWLSADNPPDAGLPTQAPSFILHTLKSLLSALFLGLMLGVVSVEFGFQIWMEHEANEWAHLLSSALFVSVGAGCTGYAILKFVRLIHYRVASFFARDGRYHRGRIIARMDSEGWATWTYIIKIQGRYFVGKATGRSGSAGLGDWITLWVFSDHRYAFAQGKKISGFSRLR